VGRSRKEALGPPIGEVLVDRGLPTVAVGTKERIREEKVKPRSFEGGHEGHLCRPPSGLCVKMRPALWGATMACAVEKPGRPVAGVATRVIAACTITWWRIEAFLYRDRTPT
jgi:hypothetical protein